MKSSIKIALGENNDPIIRFHIVPSDDIRDQLCQQFLRKFGGTSTICNVDINGVDTEGALQYWLDIAPVPGGPTAVVNSVDSINQICGIEMAVRELRNLPWVICVYDGTTVWWENSNHLSAPNPKLAMSPVLNRRELEKLSTYNLTRKIIEVFDTIDKWSVIAD